MVAYDLTHLTQPDHQLVAGPVQDDEALFLYALIRCMRLRRILEVGGVDSYGARNFLKAMEPDGMLYTVDVRHTIALQSNHTTIIGSCEALTSRDVDGVPLDLVFFDFHVYAAQMTLFRNLSAEGVINRNTVLALHDTNLHPPAVGPDAPPRQWGSAVQGGWMHQVVERQMVNTLRDEGYDALMLHTTPDRHDSRLPLRHGLTILTLPRRLDTGETAGPSGGSTPAGTGPIG